MARANIPYHFLKGFFKGDVSLSCLIMSITMPTRSGLKPGPGLTWVLCPAQPRFTWAHGLGWARPQKLKAQVGLRYDINFSLYFTITPNIV